MIKKLLSERFKIACLYPEIHYLNVEQFPLIDYDLAMKNKSNTFYVFFLVAGLFSLNAFSAPCDEKKESMSTQNEAPDEFIEFESVNDGRCQNLSTRGKLRVVKNNHPDKAIKYRFNRLFAGKRQAGMAMGTIEADGKPVKLGCTKVDGKDQTWEIKVVSFVE
ncbi:MAG: hypothetical protein AB8D52_03090 [Gammaproteobacteria bacterium]